MAKFGCPRDSVAELKSTFERHHLAEDRQAGDAAIRRMERDTTRIIKCKLTVNGDGLTASTSGKTLK
ncbi:hypothetical protein GN330_18755 [Nitratireductor sp. CAU 1489]|uniref:Uncharacterized protein n=1 Tax=Nitratireductor arenosus TaxID=2682096 RepID=A0A844QN55_9HYPH|nr:hypothetical protein [Nitratireductor arenosus]MVA99291.1 hypothetical protein [Nitratireductor arenosus]